jgi:hypothetical protein
MADSDEKTPFTFRVHRSLKLRFKKVCEAKDRSMSQKVRDFMRWYVSEHKDDLQYELEDEIS